MKLYDHKKGFTVLEFLVVVGIISLLIAMISVGLTAIRENARDDIRINTLRTVTLGVYQYYEICGSYPKELVATEDCPALVDQVPSKTLEDIIQTVDDYDFSDNGPEYFYTPLANAANPHECTGFHIGVLLERENNATAQTGAKFNGNNAYACNGASTFDASTNLKFFDIKK